MRSLAASALLLALAACRDPRGAQEISGDTFDDAPAEFAVPIPRTLDSLSVTATHPTGVTVAISRVAFEPDRMGVSLVVVNPSDKTMALNKYGKMWLRDDLGNHYDVVAPDANKDLEIFPLHQLDTLLTFQGGLAEQASALTLWTNDGHGGESNLTTQPKIAVGPISVPRERRTK